MLFFIQFVHHDISFTGRHWVCVSVCVDLYRDARLTRKVDKERWRVLYCKFVSVWSAEVCWMTHPRSFSSFSSLRSPPLLVHSGLTPPNKHHLPLLRLPSSLFFYGQHFFLLCVLFVCIPRGAVVYQRCWLKWVMWRWTLFPFVICRSHRLEGYFNAGGHEFI